MELWQLLLNFLEIVFMTEKLDYEMLILK